MELINIKSYNETRFNTAIALGNFDGVHKGHQKLISEMNKKANELGLRSSVLVFENHTKSFLDGMGPKLINSVEQKNNLFKELGVETIYTMTFDEDVMSLPPEEFVTNILINKLNCKAVVVGVDYRFGYKASGDTKLLCELGEKYGFFVEIVKPVYIDGAVVSSTRVRQLLTNGSLQMANKLLGRNYSIIGKVVPGKRIGNSLGFPTANIEPIENYVIPFNGVYSTDTILNGSTYLSATSVGYNPTFEEKSIKIESHIIDFKGDIYGQVVELVFIDYLRSEVKFNNLELLKEQIYQDILMVKTR